MMIMGWLENIHGLDEKFTPDVRLKIKKFADGLSGEKRNLLMMAKLLWLFNSSWLRYDMIMGWWRLSKKGWKITHQVGNFCHKKYHLASVFFISLLMIKSTIFL